MKTNQVSNAAAAPTHATITLDEPIQRGETTITEIVIRKPKAGELRGVSLIDIGSMNVTALQQVLPRITSPTLTAQEVGNLDLADLLQLGVEVASFLVRKADRNMAFPTA